VDVPHSDGSAEEELATLLNDVVVPAGTQAVHFHGVVASDQYSPVFAEIGYLDRGQYVIAGSGVSSPTQERGNLVYDVTIDRVPTTGAYEIRLRTLHKFVARGRLRVEKSPGTATP